MNIKQILSLWPTLISILPASFLIIAFGRSPEMFPLLRWIISFSSIFMIILATRYTYFWVLIPSHLLILALFNPLFLISFERETWFYIEFATAIIFAGWLAIFLNGRHSRLKFSYLLPYHADSLSELKPKEIPKFLFISIGVLLLTMFAGIFIMAGLFCLIAVIGFIINLLT